MHPKIYQFFTLFRGRHDGRRDLPSDLSAELTVFVSTVGARSFNDCITHLHAQDCRFRTEVIDHIDSSTLTASPIPTELLSSLANPHRLPER